MEMQITEFRLLYVDNTGFLTKNFQRANDKRSLFLNNRILYLLFLVFLKILGGQQCFRGGRPWPPLAEIFCCKGLFFLCRRKSDAVSEQRDCLHALYQFDIDFDLFDNPDLLRHRVSVGTFIEVTQKSCLK